MPAIDGISLRGMKGRSGRAPGSNTNAPAPLPGPLVIGGLGGSGTRLVAEIAQELGFFLGRDLNRQKDNLWFTLLIKARLWYAKQRRAPDPDLRPGFDILERRLAGTGRLRRPEIVYTARAVSEAARVGHNQTGSGRGGWAFERAMSILRSRGPSTGARGWGWKEPNSHIVLEQLVSRFAGLRYVHTVRHGMEIAHRQKEEELHLWGPRFGVEVPAGVDDLAGAKLRYWAEANKRAASLGRDLLGDRFLLVSYDRLCEDPARGIASLIDFLDVRAPLELRHKLESVPRVRTPREIGTPREAFRTEDLAALEEFGFQVPAELLPPKEPSAT
jgi:Sulfotransferase family